MVHASRSPRYNKLQLKGLPNIIVIIFSLHFFCNKSGNNNNHNETTLCKITKATLLPEATTTLIEETARPVNESLIARDTTPHDPITHQINDITSHSTTPPQQQCRLYLALSSIPNAGLGIYTSHPIPSSHLITDRDLPIAVTDLDSHNSHDKSFEWLLDEYYWRGVDARLQFEGYDVNVALPSIGMIGNCHAGLHNAEMKIVEPFVVDDGDEDIVGSSDDGHLMTWDRRTDPGAGAVVASPTVSWIANRDIAAGEEIFLWYGEDYFGTRSEEYGEEIPFAEHYDEADRIVRDYVNLFGSVEETTVMESNELFRRLYRIVGDFSSLFDEEEEEDDGTKALVQFLLDNGTNDTISIDPHTKQQLYILILNNLPPSTAAALPPLATSLPTIISTFGGSTARHSLPHSIKSPSWLESHGSCMDHLSIRPSLIPQAGRGAFAVRFLKRGSRIAAVPLVHVRDRDYLDMYELVPPKEDRWGVSGEDYRLEKKNDEVRGQQLLLNYCFGHPQSSLLLFPYASGVPFINHSFENHNAEIRWSSPEAFAGWNKYDDWSHRPVDEIPLERSGLMFDVVALRDIHLDEEVLINYGVEWEEAWTAHVRDWTPVMGEGEYVPSGEFNEEESVVVEGYRTVEEQEREPYPANLRTACFYVREEGMIEVEKEEVEDNYDFRVEVDYYFDRDYSMEFLRPCNIYERYELYDDDDDDDDDDETPEREYYYSAQIFNHGSNEGDDEIPMNEIHLVHDIPHYAIRFVDKPYSSDAFLKNAFRHHIGVPDGIYPPAWLNYR